MGAEILGFEPIAAAEVAVVALLAERLVEGIRRDGVTGEKEWRYGGYK